MIFVSWIISDIPGAKLYSINLNCNNDLTSSVTIQMVTTGFSLDNNLYYRTQGETEWSKVIGKRIKYFPLRKMAIRHAVIEDLTPGTIYELRTNYEKTIRKFKTLPSELSTEKPLKLAFASDCHVRDFSAEFESVNTALASYNPDVLIGKGDYTNVDGIVSDSGSEDWLYFTKEIEKTLTDQDNIIKPFLPAVGNHEMTPMYGGDPVYKEYFFDLYAFPGHKGYGQVIAGNYLQILLLDSQHANRVLGEQTEWLESYLDTSKTHVIPVYHTSCYPSEKPWPRYSWNQEILDYWWPLFESVGAKIALSGHDHTAHVTISVSSDLPDENGIRELGDGGWGGAIRPVYNPAETWYMEYCAGTRYKTGISGNHHPEDDEPADRQNANHFWAVELYSNKMVIKAINDTGNVFYEKELTQ